MLKKSDILPFILALISTGIVVGGGFGLVARVNSVSHRKNTASINLNSSENSQTIDDFQLRQIESSLQNTFNEPHIIPQGTAVINNGTNNMMKLNQALTKSFHQQFPGTFVTNDADGNEMGIKLLLSGKIDVAALDRPLDIAEQIQGLNAVRIEIPKSSLTNKSASTTFYYAYQDPANPAVEAFLGYVLSGAGQKVISNTY